MPKKQTPTTMQELIWAPGAAGLLMLTVGGVALLAGILSGLGNGYPWLFPSLDPTAYLQAESSAHPASRFYNTVAGHAIGLLAGFAAVFALGAYHDPVLLTAHQLTWGRALASAIALALTLLIALALNASHPPAGATTLLVALGAFKIEDIPAVVVGVLIAAVAGELLRRARLGQLSLGASQTERRPASQPKPPG
ncbi:MAG: HPP family protein [Chloroflexota bacterium]|nr:HPP family protein [Chloroflexota bacterium]